MSLDRMSSVPGSFRISPEPVPTTLYPGAVALGPNAGVVEGGEAGGGGALHSAHRPKSGTAQSVADSGTIVHLGYGTVIVATSTAANKTGAIVAAGSVPGQRLVIVNNSANTITMAIVATSNVANGTSCVISALAAIELVWNALDSKWYQLRAA